jgi:ABC-type sugar transport system ATPase subunit
MRLGIKQLEQRPGTSGICVIHNQVEALTPGDQLSAPPDSERLHLFDSAPGQQLAI